MPRVSIPKDLLRFAEPILPSVTRQLPLQQRRLLEQRAMLGVFPSAGN